MGSALLMCFVPVVACQAPAPSSSAQPSPFAEPPLTFDVIDDEPALDPTDFGAAYLLPGAAIVEAGTHHLYPVAFYADPAQQPRVLRLTSDDGVTWEGDADASVLEDFAMDLADPGPVPSSAFADADGTWTMYGGGRLPTADRSIIWRATAPGPDGPWTADPEPVLEPSRDGWDSGITDHPSVHATDEGYLMAYGGADRAQPNRNRIGIATSDDGISWTRQPATLGGADDGDALGPQACGVDARTMFEPHLVTTHDGVLLTFGVMVDVPDDEMQILGATSADGTDWTCVAHEALIDSADFPLSPDLHSFVTFGDGGNTTMLIEVLRNETSELWLARGSR